MTSSNELTQELLDAHNRYATERAHRLALAGELFDLRNRAGCGPEQEGPDVWQQLATERAHLARAQRIITSLGANEDFDRSALTTERAARKEAEESRALWQGRAQRAEEDWREVRGERDEALAAQKRAEAERDEAKSEAQLWGADCDRLTAERDAARAAQDRAEAELADWKNYSDVDELRSRLASLTSALAGARQCLADVPAPPLSADTLSRLADMGRARGWRSSRSGE